jgi:DNA-binding response OmpR family regulator
MSHRILLIEDEISFATGVIDLLESEGYLVEHVTSGPQGMERATKGGVDLILLDIMLPGKSGFDICRDLRSAAIGTPILMLTARGQVVDRVLGLKLGADDYVVKSTDTMELLARIEALLRRARGTAGKTYYTFELGDIRVDFERNQVTRDGNRILLSAAEFRLLKYLLEHRGTVLSREELLEKVWGFSSDILSRTVDVHMAALRKKLERDPKFPELILTVKGFGYKLAV